MDQFLPPFSVHFTPNSVLGPTILHSPEWKKHRPVVTEKRAETLLDHSSTGQYEGRTLFRLRRELLLVVLLPAVLIREAGTVSAQQTAPAEIAVSLPDTSGVASETTTIPVQVGNLTGEEIFSFEFTVRYNADTLSVVGIETSGTIASGINAAVNTDGTGKVSVSAAAMEALSGSGTLVRLIVRPKGTGRSPLVWEKFQFNEGSPGANLSGGAITVEPL